MGDVDTNLKLFLYTIKEYQRFVDQLPVGTANSLTDSYSESEYVSIQVRLMLLRKYFSKGDNVYFGNLVEIARNNFPEHLEDIKKISERFDAIHSEQLEHMLTDGTKLNLYETIEDTVYGLYLHADAIKIANLVNTDESLRYICIRKYVLDVEKVVFDFCKILKMCGVTSELARNNDRSPAIFLGDPNSSPRAIVGSPYWKNLHGHDLDDSDLNKIISDTSLEDGQIILLCRNFINEVLEKSLKLKDVRKYIYPLTRYDWGDFSEAQKVLSVVQNLGINLKVRYNDNHSVAYVLIFSNIDEALIIKGPHVMNNLLQFSFKKWCGKWRVFSLSRNTEAH